MRGYQWARGVKREKKEGEKERTRRGNEAGQCRVVDDDISESGLDSFQKS